MWAFLKPKSAIYWYNLGIDLYEAGNYNKSLKVLGKGLKKAPEMAEIYYMQGLCYQQLEKMTEAKAAFQQALTLNPDDIDSLYNLARILYNEDDIDTACAYAEQADSLISEECDAQVSYLLGLMYEQQNRIDEAIVAYEKSLQQESKQDLTRFFLAKLYIQKQQYQAAIDQLKQLAETDPNNLDVNYELSLCLAKIGDWQGTITYCQRVIELDPENKKGFNQLGLAMYCTGNLEQALANYNKALSLDPVYATAMNNLAYTYEKLGRFEEAIDNFTHYITLPEVKPEEVAELKGHIELLQHKLLELKGESDTDEVPNTPNKAETVLTTEESPTVASAEATVEEASAITTDIKKDHEQEA